MQDLLKVLSLAVHSGRTKVVEAVLAEEFDKSLAFDSLCDDDDVATALALVAANAQIFGRSGDFSFVAARLLRSFTRIVESRPYFSTVCDPIIIGDARDEEAEDLIAEGKLAEAAAVIAHLCDQNNLILILAAAFGHVAIIKALIAAGADINVQNHEGRTALMVATRFGQIAIVQALIEAGAELDKSCTESSWLERDERERTALIIAAKFDQLLIAKALIKAKAKLNIQDAQKRTALIWAAENSSIEIAKLLIEEGADLDIRDSADKNALMIANAELAALLVNGGADLNFRNCDDDTALIYAVRDDDLEKVHVLLAAKVKMNQRDSEDKSALAIAIDNGSLDIARALKNAGAKLFDSRLG